MRCPLSLFCNVWFGLALPLGCRSSDVIRAVNKERGHLPYHHPRMRGRTAISKPRFLYRYIMYIVQSLRRGFGMKKSTTFDTLDRLQKYSPRARCRLESSTLFFIFDQPRRGGRFINAFSRCRSIRRRQFFFALLFRGFPSVRYAYGKGCYVSAVSFD